MPRRLLWLLSFLTVLFVISILIDFLPEPGPLHRFYSAVEPFGVALVTVLFILVVAAQIYRYVRVSGPLAREQAKSFILGLLLAFDR